MFGRRGNDGVLRTRAATLATRRDGHLTVAPSPHGSLAEKPHGSWAAPSRLPASENTVAATTIGVEAARALLQPIIDGKLESAAAQRRARDDVAREVEEIIGAALAERGLAVDPIDQRQLITVLLNGILDAGRQRQVTGQRPPTMARRAGRDQAIPRIYPLIMERIDSEVAAKLGRPELQQQLTGVVADILGGQKIPPNQVAQRALLTTLVNNKLRLVPPPP